MSDSTPMDTHPKGNPSPQSDKLVWGGLFVLLVLIFSACNSSDSTEDSLIRACEDNYQSALSAGTLAGGVTQESYVRVCVSTNGFDPNSQEIADAVNEHFDCSSGYCEPRNP